MDYYIFLKNTKEYIVETDDDLIWTRTRDITYAFNDTDFNAVNNLAQFISKDKHISMNDISIIGEEVILQHTEYPVGNLKPLYYYDNELSDSIDGLQFKLNKFNVKIHMSTFDDFYYVINTIQELLDWCATNGYEWYELEKHFKIKLWEE